MADELTDDELNSLLRAARKSPLSSAGEPASTPLPMAYDFKRPQRVNKDHMRALENVHEQCGRLFSATLSASMRMVIDVDLAFIDQTLYSEFILSLPTPCGSYTFALDPPGTQAVLCLAPELIMSIIDRALGGKGQSLSGDMRPLTQIERTIVNKLVSRLLADFESSWDPHCSLQVSDVALETNPEFIRIANSGDPVVMAAYEVHSNHANGLVHLCYPLATVDPLIAHLTGSTHPTPKESDSQARIIDNRALGTMSVSTVVQIARGSLPLSEVAQLTAGDVIKLDTKRTDPAVVFVGNQPKFFARAGLDGRRRAAQILSTISASEEELYR